VIEPPTDTFTVIGSDFVGYRIEDLIGRGGMGVVYRAYDLRLKRTVALKLVAPSLARDERFRSRFERESELVMSLEHPNVVPIYDAGDVDGRVYLAMRLVDGTDLRSLLRAEGALEPLRAVAISTQLASALDAAHARGLVHRDVKPSNVLLDQTGHVYLSDFGLTRRLEDQAAAIGDDRSLGTPAYLAPEQLEGKPVDGRADVYSLGCLLYECLTGEAVFPRSSRLAVAWAHLEEEPPRASRRRLELPDAIDPVISRAMAKEPEERYPTCGALVAAAEGALGFRKAGLFQRRKPLLASAAVLLAVLVAAVLATRSGKPAKAVAPLLAPANTLARIDPTTNRVSAVIDVGSDPVASAAGGHSVWVYNRDSGTISEVDTRTNRVRKTLAVSYLQPTGCCGVFTGPVLAADASGAWFVNGGFDSKPLLTHLPASGRGKREYPLDLTPTGVAVGDGAVWVVGHRGNDYRVVRIDPSTGHSTATQGVPASARIDSIAFGYGAVWVVSSSNATLYRIDPRSARMTGRLVLPYARATRPQIMPRGGDIWIRATGDGGVVYSIDPSPLGVNPGSETDGPPDWEEYRGELGALWWYDWPTGAVYRQEVANGPIRRIVVTRLPTVGGQCLTSMSAGSGSLWLTVAPANGFVCRR
jgi:serine/threonine-protein kinase